MTYFQVFEGFHNDLWIMFAKRKEKQLFCCERIRCFRHFDILGTDLKKTLSFSRLGLHEAHMGNNKCSDFFTDLKGKQSKKAT